MFMTVAISKKQRNQQKPLNKQFCFVTKGFPEVFIGKMI